MRKVINFAITTLLLIGCLDRVELRDIKIRNESEYDVYCLFSSTDKLITQYSVFGDYKVFDNSLIKKDSINVIYNKPRDWSSYIKHSVDGKMRLFFIAKDSVEKYGWEDVLTRNIFTHVYKLDLKDLNRKNWELVY